ncbi:MAG: alpha/beta-hydrolase N-terminal domain-containing protein, partial [Mycobacterium sp.]
MTDTGEGAVAIENATPNDETPAPAPAPAPAARKAWWIRRYTFTGTAVGLVFLYFSLTPSLLPRGPLFQGLVSGGAGAIGY